MTISQSGDYQMWCDASRRPGLDVGRHVCQGGVGMSFSDRKQFWGIRPNKKIVSGPGRWQVGSKDLSVSQPSPSEKRMKRERERYKKDPATQQVCSHPRVRLLLRRFADCEFKSSRPLRPMETRRNKMPRDRGLDCLGVNECSERGRSVERGKKTEIPRGIAKTMAIRRWLEEEDTHSPVRLVCNFPHNPDQRKKAQGDDNSSRAAP